MAITENTDHVTEALALLLEQYKGKATLEALLDSYIEQIQLAETAAYDTWYDRLLDNATTEQLDELGVIVRQERASDDDDIYRAFIRARIAINRSNGRTEELINILRIVSLETDLYNVRDTGNASIIVETLTPQTSVWADTILTLMQEAKSGGVKLQVVWSPRAEADKFTFAPAGVAQADKIVPSTDDGYHTLSQSVSLVDGTAYELEALIARKEYAHAWLGFDGLLPAAPLLDYDDIVFTRSGSDAHIADTQNDQVLGPFDGITLAKTTISGRVFGQYESERTNLFTQPYDLSHGDWGKTRLETPTAAADPVGGSTAWKLIPTIDNNDHNIYQNSAADGSSPYSLSVIAEAGEYGWIRLRMGTGGFPSDPWCYFDLNNGVVGTDNACDTFGIKPLGNGRYHCGISATSDAPGTSNKLISVAEDDNDLIFAGNGTDGLYVWNPQIEKGVWPSSPHSGTRNNEEASFAAVDVPDALRTRKHVVYWIPEAASTDARDIQTIYTFRDPVTNIQLHIQWHTDDTVRAIKYDGGWTTLADTTAVVCSRGQLMRIVIDPSEGTIEVLDATGGGAIDNTEAWDKLISSTSALYYGDRHLSDQSANALLSLPFVVPFAHFDLSRLEVSEFLGVDFSSMTQYEGKYYRCKIRMTSDVTGSVDALLGLADREKRVFAGDASGGIVASEVTCNAVGSAVNLLSSGDDLDSTDWTQENIEEMVANDPPCLINETPLLDYDDIVFTRSASDARIADTINQRVLGVFDGDTVATTIINGLTFGQYQTARTNLFTQPYDLSHGDWGKADLETPVAQTDPLGTSTAWSAVPNTDNDVHYFSQTKTPDASSVYSLHGIAKANGYVWIRPSLEGAGFVGTPYCNFNLETGATGTVLNCDTYGIDYLGDGWYHYWITATSDAASASWARTYICSADNTTVFPGNSIDGITVWNPQYEVGVWPSSPHEGTRNKDRAYFPAASVDAQIRTGRHILYWIPNAASTDTRGNQVIYNLNDSATGYRLVVYLKTDDGIRVSKYDGSDTTLVETAALTWARGSLYRIVIDPAEGSIEVDATGGDKVVGSSWDTFVTAVSDLYLGSDRLFNLQLDGLLSLPILPDRKGFASVSQTSGGYLVGIKA